MTEGKVDSYCLVLNRAALHTRFRLAYDIFGDCLDSVFYNDKVPRPGRDISDLLTFLTTRVAPAYSATFVGLGRSPDPNLATGY